MRDFIRFIFMGCLLVGVDNVSAAKIGDYEITTIGPDGVLDFDPNTNTSTLRNGVRVNFKKGTPDATELTADTGTINHTTDDMTATGNVILRRDGTVWKAERLDYNFKTKAVSSVQFRTGSLSYFMRGQAMDGNQTKGVYRAKGIQFTTDDVDTPAMFIRAKEVEVAPGDYIIFRNATLYIGKVPVMFLPYYKRSLKRHPWNVNVKPGYRSEWGAFVENSIRWPGTENYQGELSLDYRTARGWGVGPRIEYSSPKWGDSYFRAYRAWDDDPLTDSRNNAIDRERDLLRWHHRYSRDGLSFTGVLEYESDEYMRRDFFEDLYREDVQADSYLELSKNWENYNLSVLASPRLNAFYEHTDRLPDIKLSGTRYQLGDTPYFYDTETSIGYFTRRYDYSSSSEDYSLLRADSLHQIYRPMVLNGWLNVTPRIGGRFTHYGETDGRGSTKDASERYVFNSGVEISTKLSRHFPELKSSLLGIDGARHIVEPSINYIFIPRPNRIPNELDKIDYEITSARLLPLEMPEYNAIDNINAQNAVRLGIRQRLQTKRNGSVVDVVDWNLYTDWRIDPNTDQNGYSDVFSDTIFRPRDWLSLNSRVRYDLDNNLWRTLDHSFTITPNPTQWSINGGHYYYLQQPNTAKDDRSSSLYGGLNLSLDENWSFHTRQYFDAKKGEHAGHNYVFYRDMRSWTFFVNVKFRKDTGRRDDEISISLNYSLKAFPREPSFD